MRNLATSHIMPRTTVDIDASVLRQLKRIARSERKSLGRLISELLAMALRSSPDMPGALAWTARPMRARVDLDDPEAVRRILDES